MSKISIASLNTPANPSRGPPWLVHSRLSCVGDAARLIQMMGKHGGLSL
jgi:hypothetical protein